MVVPPLLPLFVTIDGYKGLWYFRNLRGYPRIDDVFPKR